MEFVLLTLLEVIRTDYILTIYMFIVVAASALITWVQPNPYNPIVRFPLSRVTEPVYSKIRRIHSDQFRRL